MINVTCVIKVHAIHKKVRVDRVEKKEKTFNYGWTYIQSVIIGRNLEIIFLKNT